MHAPKLSLTRPALLWSARVFVAVVRSYGIAWSAEMASPVKPTDVWHRMMRNLVNCHEQTGNLETLRVLQDMFNCRASMPPDEAAHTLDYEYVGNLEMVPPEEAMRRHQQQLQQQQLMRMLQVLQLQQHAS